MRPERSPSSVSTKLDFARDAISWISPIAKTLLNADMGNWITLEDGRSAKIVKIEI